jgi:hypothetical protein
VVVVADEPNELERLVAQRILEQLREGGLQGLIEAQKQLEAQMEGAKRGEAALEVSVQLEADGHVETQSTDLVGITDSLDVVISPGPAVLVLRGAAPELAIDIEGRSPQDINLAVNLYMAFVTTLGVLLQLWQMFHHQAPTQTQIIEIFNQTTTVVHQTLNMPPPPPLPAGQ